MTEYDRLPSLKDDLLWLKRGVEADWRYTSAVTSEDGDQYPEGVIVGGGPGDENEHDGYMSTSTAPAPLDLVVSVTSNNGVISGLAEWQIDITEPGWEGIVGWQIDWTPAAGSAVRKQTVDSNMADPYDFRRERVEGLVANTAYTVRVRGVTAAGTPGASASASVTTGSVTITSGTFTDVDVLGRFDTRGEAGDGIYVIDESILMFKGGIQCGKIWIGTGTTPNIHLQSDRNGTLDTALTLESLTSGTPEAHVRNGNLDTYRPIRASAFTVNSDARGKTNIADVDVNDVQLRPRKFQIREEVEQFGDDAPWHTGFVAQEVPEPARRVSSTGLVGYDMEKMLAHMAAQLNALQDEVAELKRQRG